VRLAAAEGDPKLKLRITLRPDAGLPMRLMPRGSGPHLVAEAQLFWVTRSSREPSVFGVCVCARIFFFHDGLTRAFLAMTSPLFACSGRERR
jgi:hypothetical protein